MKLGAKNTCEKEESEGKAMKLWKRWTAAILAAAMALVLLAACSGPFDVVRDPNEQTTEKERMAAVVESLNAVRKEKGLEELTLDADACKIAEQMAQVQLDGLTGAYGEAMGEGSDYSKKCTELRNEKVQGKASVGFGALYNQYPNAKRFKDWENSTNATSAERYQALVRSGSTTLVGVGVVQNPDTTSEYKYMVVVMTY